MINDGPLMSSPSTFTGNNEDTNTSPSTLRVKLRNPFLNGSADHNDQEYMMKKLISILLLFYTTVILVPTRQRI